MANSNPELVHILSPSESSPEVGTSPPETAATSKHRRRSSKASSDAIPPMSVSTLPASKHVAAPSTKTDLILIKLKSAKGTTIEAMREATGWQAHSVRGFLSGTVKRKLGLAVTSEIGKDGVRSYRICTSGEAEG
ncbi:DUF3489 domain-containing protein [Mesorhizobium sp. Root552]|uniref:DUF3489 domain-containing protein n=1 Tax=Mesorhizobium sp. Root552 TaxID=1736555 RepID=UPI000ACC68C9|nr:DUF3489 domain-containing protein [Mesorhizobium sp. Root552]